MSECEGSLKMKSLLEDLGKTHNLPGLLLCCAEWTADDIDCFSFKSLPIKTSEVCEYEDIPREQRKDLTPDYYRFHPGVMIYYNLASRIKAENISTYEWLKECRSRLSDRPELVARIDRKLKEATVEQIK